MSKLLTISEVTEITRLSKASLYAYVAAKKIPYVKLGARVLFSPDELQDWIDQRKVKAIGGKI